MWALETSKYQLKTYIVIGGQTLNSPTPLAAVTSCPTTSICHGPEVKSLPRTHAGSRSLGTPDCAGVLPNTVFLLHW